MHLLVSGTAVAGNVVRLAKTRKNFNFLRGIDVLDLMLKYCSGMIEGNWIHCSLIHCVGEDSCNLHWTEFVFISGSGLSFKFSRVALLFKRLQMRSKTVLSTNGLFFDFFVEIYLV